MSKGTIGRISATELAGILGTDREPFILDVREKDEFEAWAIPGATLIPLAELGDRLAELPADKEIVTVCAAGSRSATAANILSHQGYAVSDLTGGMSAWAVVYDTIEIDLKGCKVIQVRRRSKGCLSYIIGGADGSALVVDPSAEIWRYIEIADAYGWSIEAVADTHLHADHISGARELAKSTGAVLRLNPADTFEFDYVPLIDGDEFRISDTTTVTVHAITTPGHTLGSTIFTIGDEAVITGDTLFVDGVGRPDLAERAAEFAANLYDSLHTRVLNLSPNALVLPAHYGMGEAVRPTQAVTTTISELKGRLQALSLSRSDFIQWASERATERPPNYIEIILANMGRSDRSVDYLSMLEVGPNRCSA